MTNKEKNMILDVLYENINEYQVSLVKISNMLILDAIMFLSSATITAYLIPEENMIAASGFFILGMYSSYMAAITKETFDDLIDEIRMTKDEIEGIKGAKTE